MKTSIIKKSKINLLSRFTLLLITVVIWMHSVQGQESAKIPSPAEIQLQVVKSGHPWQPPFGVDRVGASYDVIVTIKSRELPAGKFLLVGYLQGKEVSRQDIHLINKTPFTGFMPGNNKRFAICFEGSQAFTDRTAMAFTGRSTMIENTDQLILFFVGSGKNPIELIRQVVKLPSFEAEAIAMPDKVINPIDLGAILVPVDWLLLTGGQKAYVTIAALNRSNDISAVRITAWYNSAPQNKVNEPLPLSHGTRAEKDLPLPACSKTLENDILHVSIEDAEGKELWHKQIQVMIVPKQPTWPIFGAVNTKLRYDSPILNIVNGKNDSIDYDKAWSPEFQDLVVFLPIGSRWVFWRGTSYIPIWAGKYNTGLSYEWAERISPNVGFTDCPEPLMDKELRYSRVEIVESTNARIHIRWSYQSCDFNYKLNGDLSVEDYYF